MKEYPVSHYLAEVGTRGGRSRSEKKIEAARANIAKAREAKRAKILSKAREEAEGK